jgi:hypothetical protein
VDWKQTDTGLVVTLPAQKPSPYTCGLKISGSDLRPAPVAEAAALVQPETQGKFSPLALGFGLYR